MSSAPTVYMPGYFIKEECITSYQEEQGGYFITCPCNSSCKCEYYPMTPDEKRCLDDRKYWCFLLSSIITFCACLILVVMWRIIYSCVEDCLDERRMRQLEQIEEFENHNDLNNENEDHDEWADAFQIVRRRHQQNQGSRPSVDISVIDTGDDNGQQQYVEHDYNRPLRPPLSVSRENLAYQQKAHRRRSTISSAGLGGGAHSRRSSHVSATFFERLQPQAREEQRRWRADHERRQTILVNTATEAAKLQEQQIDQISWMTEAKDYAGELISGQTSSGRVLVVLSFVMTVASLILYFYDASNPTFQVEICVKWTESPTQQLDFGLNMFFLAYFFIRLIASPDKVWFLIEVYNFVDFFTIPPSFVALYLGRHWLGLRFLRALRLMSVPDILQYLNILKTSGSIRLAQLLSIFISVSLAAAGVIHLLENSGDPWRNFDNPRRISYWDCVYFLVVTMGTVGYGDLACTTSLARLFMIFFILGGLAMFASYIPEIVDIVGSRPKYRSRFEPERGKKHVLVCGYITSDSVNHLIQNFMLDEKSPFDIQLVFLHRKLPDLELEGLLKRHFTKMEFIHGSAMEPSDLAKVNVEQADACLVLANKYASDPDAEDAANIMRVVSLKNYCSDTRVIVQLIQFHSKTYLLNIPTWNWRQGDDVVCLGELKLGILAQSCLSPGVSTLLANLFTMRDIQEGSIVQPWQGAYMRGSNMNIFMETLSHSFVGMSFPAAADFIFSRLRVLLIAVEIKDEEARECNILINPPPDTHITIHTQGFFVAPSIEDVKRFLCNLVSLFRKGARPNSMMIKQVKRQRGQSLIAETSLISPSLHRMNSAQFTPTQFTAPKLEMLDEEDVKFDSTGMFHWCPPRPIEDVVLERSRSSRVSLTGHVVVCLFADTLSPLLGLANFVMPLRSSNLHYHELKRIVIVGNLNYLRREWNVLQNLPKISILVGHPICRADLRAVNLNACEICVIISARTPNPQEDPTLADKEAILASLNIKAMRFDDFRSEFLREYVAPSSSSVAEFAVYERMTMAGADIRILTELANDTNVQFLDQEDEDDPDTSFRLTLPFACGHAFAVSVLDSLMSMTYFNDSTLTLIRSLVTGGASIELEMILAEGAGLLPAKSAADVLTKRNRCRIVQYPLDHRIFAGAQSGFTYGHLFRRALRQNGVLCLGLYRLLDEQQDPEFGKRLVITNPEPETFLFDNDQVFALQPFDHGFKFNKRRRRDSEQIIYDDDSDDDDEEDED